jgi:hypothetical protein
MHDYESLDCRHPQNQSLKRAPHQPMMAVVPKWLGIAEMQEEHHGSLATDTTTSAWHANMDKSQRTHLRTFSLTEGRSLGMFFWYHWSFRDGLTTKRR